MKTKLTAVTYLGFTSMERGYSNAMLPWLIKEIRTSGVHDKLSIALEDGCLKAYNGNFEPVLVHRLVDIFRASQVPGHPEELFYILLDEKAGLLHCYLYRAASGDEVSELFTQMREPSPGFTSPRGSAGALAVTKNAAFQRPGADPPWAAPGAPGAPNTQLTTEAQTGLERSVSNASSALISLCADLSPSDSHFFEVLYIGKVRISQRKVPESLIDDALHKFAQHEAEKERSLSHRRHSMLSSTGTSIYSNDSTETVDKTEQTDFTTRKYNITASNTPLEPDKTTIWKSVDNVNNSVKDKKDNIKDNRVAGRPHDVDDEFDTFTKERVEINAKKPSQIPLEPNIVVLNVPKTNLGTVAEEKSEEIHSIIKETASSITQFCTTNTYNDLDDSNLAKDIKTEISKEHKIGTENLNIQESQSDPLMKTTVDKEKADLQDKIQKKDLKLNLKKQDSFERADSPAPVFHEIPRKPVGVVNERRNSPMPENKPFLRDRSASIGTLNLKTPIAQFIGEQNRTMLFQVGRSELRLISPDRKQILLHRAFKDVASCVLGRVNKEHFGFVCRETANDSYACYVFKCESDSVATEVINAIKQAFVAHSELIKKSREKSPNLSCEHCPMLWYHRLCHDVEGMNEKRTHAFILRRIEQLPEEEQELLITKYRGGTHHMYEVSEHNAFLMMLLRAHCEARQLRHVHDTAENRSEFLNQYLGGSTIFMKAKRSLSSGFDHLLKRRASKDESTALGKKEPSPLNTPTSESDPSGQLELLSPDIARSKSVSPAATANGSSVDGGPTPNVASTMEEEPEDVKEEVGTPVNSPMMDIFLKVSDNRPTVTEPGTEPDATWRQAIYEKVVDVQEGDLTPKALFGIPSAPAGKRTRDELRQLWRLAIDQTILLVRMEKENARLKQNEESSAVRRIKLEYVELGGCDAGAAAMWDALLAARDRQQPAASVDRHMLTQVVRQGVPRMSRGAVWYFLAEQRCAMSAPPDVTRYPLYHAPYAALLGGLTKHQHAILIDLVWYFLAEQRCAMSAPPDVTRHPLYHAPYAALLGGLTKHQHAILIDLGRTFPKHSYFASALGPGQLALYNILKAYSLLDPEVGYCQGLSFVAGVLLLHMEEAEAFVLLRHLMFRRGLRNQYLPDMSALQVQLYQLSRLVRDREPELHARLEQLDVAPALYAAPWMLTLFTSQFPLGFVVRVFDLIFLDSLDIVFAVSLALLSAHKDGLMLCESCEEAAEYLKHKLPDIDQGMCRRVMKKVHSLDISRQLSEYAVEYAVLREEMPRLATLAEENRRLAAQGGRLAGQLDSAVDAITSYQKTQTKLETQNKQMEQHLTLLSRFISAHRQDMPLEIKKIVQTYSKKLSFSSKILKFTSNDPEVHEEVADDQKKMFKSGVSAPNLFAKISRDEVMNAMNREKNKVSPETDKRTMMKKSHSIHTGLVPPNSRQYPLKALEENENEYSRSDSFRSDVLKESLKELGKKNGGFFASTHEQIRQERLFEQQLKHDFDENLKKSDEKLGKKSFIDDLSVFQSRKCMSLNIVAGKGNKVDELVTNDSGFVTPMSPNDADKKDDNCSIISHPLSDCDVDIKFDGQVTKLKQIRPFKSSNVEKIYK